MTLINFNELAKNRVEIPLWLDGNWEATYLNNKIKENLLNNPDKEIVITIYESSVYSNACAPVAGIIDYYRNKGVKLYVNYQVTNFYATLTHIDSPISSGNDHYYDELESPFDKVWRFGSSKEINLIVTAYLNTIRKTVEIEEGIILSMEWCINEAMDNVLQHSNAGYGFVMGQIHRSTNRLAICIFDNGIGIYNSLKNTSNHPATPFDAITMALQEGITRDTKIGQGNGLWGLSEIVREAKGYLHISSCGAGYWYKGGAEERKLCNDFRYDEDFGSTNVDVQFSFDKRIDITKALNGYRPLDNWEDDREDDNEHIIIDIAKEASGTGTRQAAEMLRNTVYNVYKEHKKLIVLDFSRVNFVSSSFADELVGKLLAKMGFVNFINCFRLKSLNNVCATIVNRSVEQRMAQLFFETEINETE